MNKSDLERHATAADADALRFAADPHGGPLAKLRRLDAGVLRSLARQALGRPEKGSSAEPESGRPTP